MASIGRTANRQQRRMLVAMYPTCAHPHCEIGFIQCRIHHIEWFTNGGTTTPHPRSGVIGCGEAVTGEHLTCTNTTGDR